ncbi:MAG TPA: gamma-glutamyltransferase family protein [Candidatus Dormibacteraeota bacterium]|nr:gamma-glutamyltransferase family protein [Candidatus Dormibacteraeota bacterium]
MSLTHGVVAAPHYLAAEAGAEVLRQGGNAVDAAVAADAVLCVVYPHMTSVGGDLFALVWPAGAVRPIGLAGAGRSGSLATIDAVRSHGHRTMPERGPLTVTVPGTVEAWGRLVERFGSLGMAPLLAAAVRCARHGFTVTANLATFLNDHAGWLMADSESARLLPPLKAGMRLRNPELADTLAAIGEAGFHRFYRGDTARAIVSTLERRGGLLTLEDLAQHRSQWVEPLEVRYRDLTVYELPPPTQGLVAAGILRRLERVDRPRLEPGLAFATELRRARDAVYPLRDRYLTDPDFTPVPWEPFLDPSWRETGATPAIPEGDTIYLCTADEHGNVVSLIQSVAGTFGSGIFAEGTGVLLQNRGMYFSLDPRHVNRLEPRKRTMHTLIPAMVGREGRCWAAFGSMGADGQPQIQAQLLVNLVDRGLDPATAVAAPRLRVPPGGDGLWIEADYPEAGRLVRSVEGAQLLPARSWQMGHAQILVVDGQRSWRAGADPRADGAVVVV